MKISCVLSAFIFTLSSTNALDIWNTFEDSVITGGKEMLFQYAGPTFSGPGVEFEMFPKNLPPMHGDPESGVYNIDFAGTNTNPTITYTLIDGTGATDFLMPEGRFDRYYIDVGVPVADVMVVSSTENMKVEAMAIPHTGNTREIVDLMGMGFDFFPDLPKGGIMIQVGPGSDLTTPGEEFVISYKTPPPKLDETVKIVHQSLMAQAYLNDLVAKVKAGEPIEQPDCLGQDPKVHNRAFCNTMPPTFDEIDDLVYLLHPMLPAGGTMDPLKKMAPNTYQISKWNYLPLYEQIYNENAPLSCDSYSGVRPAQIYGGIAGPLTSQTIFATAPFMADTSPYFSDDSRRRLQKKSKKKGKKAKGEAMAVPEKKMEMIMCGFSFVENKAEIEF